MSASPGDGKHLTLDEDERRGFLEITTLIKCRELENRVVVWHQTEDAGNDRVVMDKLMWRRARRIRFLGSLPKKGSSVHPRLGNGITSAWHVCHGADSVLALDFVM